MWRRNLSSSSNNSTRALLNEKKWDALVISGGHNGLTTAAYLARSDLSVAVLERRHLIGCAAVTEELIPGFKLLPLQLPSKPPLSFHHQGIGVSEAWIKVTEEESIIFHALSGRTISSLGSRYRT